MAKKKKTKYINVIFLNDYEKYKKGEIGKVSQSLFSNVLKRKNIAKELTKKDEINYQKIIKKQEEKKQIEEYKIENELKELKNISIEEIYNGFDSFYKELTIQDIENFDELVKKIAKKIKISIKEKDIKILSNSKIREYYNMIGNLLEKETFNKEFLEIILSKAKYDLGRVKTINQSFIDFLRYNIKRIGNEKKYLFIFKKHFELILAYTI